MDEQVTVESPALLSPRVHQVAHLAADGFTNKEIARELSISPATVKNHIHIAIAKLGVRRRAAIGKALSENPA